MTTRVRYAKRGALVLLAALALAAAWQRDRAALGLDFYQFWAVGQALAQSSAPDLYTDSGRRRVGALALAAASRTDPPASMRQRAVAQRRRVLETYSTPLLYTAFRYTFPGDYEADFRNYRLALLGSLPLAIGLWSRAAGVPAGHALLAVAAVACCFAPFRSDLRVGNVNTLQLLFVSAYLAVLARRRGRSSEIASGAILGSAVLFKPTLAFVPGLLAIWWLASGRRGSLVAHAIGAGAAAALALAVSSACFGSSWIWVDWVIALRALPDEIIAVAQGNSAPAKLIAETLGLDAALPLTLVLSAIAAVALWHARGTPEQAPEGFSATALIVALGCLIPLLGSRLAWLHYFVLAIPMLLSLWSAAEARDRGAVLWSRRIALAVAFALLARTPLRWVAADVGETAAAALAGAATLGLFAMGVHELSRLARAQPIAGS